MTTGTGNDSVSVKGMSAAGSVALDGGDGVDSFTVDFSHATATVFGSYGGSGSMSDGTTTVSLFNAETLTYIGGSAGDSMSTDAGDDTLKGDAGDDFDSFTVDFSHATATVFGSYGGSGSMSDGTTTVSLFNAETLTYIGGSANDSMSTDAGDDTLKGNAGDDFLDGEAGNDTI